MTEEEKAVLAGVELLNEKIPGWEQLIDWDILDIWSLGNCIIGQLEDEHPGTLRLLGLDGYYESSQYGFDIHTGLGQAAFEPLTQAWKAWGKGNVR